MAACAAGDREIHDGDLGLVVGHRPSLFGMCRVSHAHVTDVLFLAVAVYFVSAFLLLYLNRDHDSADENCACPFCRREERV